MNAMIVFAKRGAIGYPNPLYVPTWAMIEQPPRQQMVMYMGSFIILNSM